MNNREMIRGFTSIQHVLGRAPDETDRIFDTTAANSPDLCTVHPHEEFRVTSQLRLAAEKVFLHWTNSQRLQRARNSKRRRLLDCLDFNAGGQVFNLEEAGCKTCEDHRRKICWPSSNLGYGIAKGCRGSFDPGLFSVACERSPLVETLSRATRHASDREQIIDELHSEISQPWTFPQIAEELGGNDYEDWSEQPDEEEWL